MGCAQAKSSKANSMTATADAIGTKKRVEAPIADEDYPVVASPSAFELERPPEMLFSSPRTSLSPQSPLRNTADVLQVVLPFLPRIRGSPRRARVGIACASGRGLGGAPKPLFTDCCA
eukprot:3881122-Prymnesium_polylepis.1